MAACSGGAGSAAGTYVAARLSCFFEKMSNHIIITKTKIKSKDWGIFALLQFNDERRMNARASFIVSEEPNFDKYSAILHFKLKFLGDENCKIGYPVIARDGAKSEKNKGVRDRIFS